jgi:hypothetical protein
MPLEQHCVSVQFIPAFQNILPNAANSALPVRFSGFRFQFSVLHRRGLLVSELQNFSAGNTAHGKNSLKTSFELCELRASAVKIPVSDFSFSSFDCRHAQL